MGRFGSKECVFLLLALLVTYTRSDDLPDDFLVGFATASYQVEGAWDEDGKSPNIWDQLTHTHPDWIADKSNGDIADDQYHHYEEDIQIIKSLGAQVYRFSISWSRIFPSIVNYQVNQAGLDYYNRLIDETIANGIIPMATIYRWDLPQYIQELGGWTNDRIIDLYEDYAKVLFENLGDRVKWWITFNEPLEFCQLAYGGADGAPALNMSGVADYLCTHNMLKSHARAYHLYNNTFRPQQKGTIGITMNGGYNAPLTNSSADIEAAETMNLFEVGWFADPIFGKGDYPEVMRRNVDRNSAAEGRPRSRLPRFTQDEVDYIKGTADFYGMNHYSTRLATPAFYDPTSEGSYQKDAGVQLSIDPSWPGAASPWLLVVPWGFRRLINFVNDRYNGIPIIITENGFSDTDGIEDFDRINYYHDYIEQVLLSIKEDGCNVKGYMAWSILDNFEWRAGYTQRFGVVHINYTDPQRTRTKKLSASYLQELYTTRNLPPVGPGTKWSKK